MELDYTKTVQYIIQAFGNLGQKASTWLLQSKNVSNEIDRNHYFF